MLDLLAAQRSAQAKLTFAGQRVSKPALPPNPSLHLWYGPPRTPRLALAHRHELAGILAPPLVESPPLPAPPLDDKICAGLKAPVKRDILTLAMRSTAPGQLRLDLDDPNAHQGRDPAFSWNKAEPVHRWVPWIAGYSAGFVRSVIGEHAERIGPGCIVLDPFAGVGTTLVEALAAGLPAVGFEINPYAALVCRAKLRAFATDPDEFEACIHRFEERCSAEANAYYPEQRPEAFRSRIPFFSPPVERKVTVVLKAIRTDVPPGLRDLFLAALGAVMVSFSNYTYEPSLGTRPGAGKPLVKDAPVADIVATKLHEMHEDILWLHRHASSRAKLWWCVEDASFFDRAPQTLPDGSAALVVTSPPYLNNYHYVRNTRPQMYWLGLVSSTSHTRRLSQQNYGAFWQVVRSGPQIDLEFDNPELSELIRTLRSTNAERGPYGGPGWANYVARYFNDTRRFLDLLSRLLARGGTAVIVVGNSIIQGISIDVPRYLAQIAEGCGLLHDRSDVVRAKRVGSSIVGSSVRRDDGRLDGSLSEVAVVLRRP